MGGNFGRGVRGSILKPTPIIFIYLAFEKTAYSYTVLLINIPFHIGDLDHHMPKSMFFPNSRQKFPNLTKTKVFFVVVFFFWEGGWRRGGSTFISYLFVCLF